MAIGLRDKGLAIGTRYLTKIVICKIMRVHFVSLLAVDIYSTSDIHYLKRQAKSLFFFPNGYFMFMHKFLTNLLLLNSLMLSYFEALL